MGRLLKLATVVTLVGVTAGALSMSMLSLATPHERPAGCHEHQQGAPRHPARYTCCMAGHDSAIPLTSFVPKLQLTTDRVVPRSIFRVEILNDPPREFVLIRSGDPPGITQLRI